MVKIHKHDSTRMQEAYARRVYSGGGKKESKYDIAIDVGYSPSVARSPKQKIESTQGFKNVIAILAEQSDNVAMKILNEFETRDMSEYSNKDLNSALHAIAIARDKFQPKENADQGTSIGRLRSVVLQRIENQTINTTQVQPVQPVEVEQTQGEEKEEEEGGITEDTLDF